MYLFPCTDIPNKGTTETLRSIKILLSAAGLVVSAGIYNYLPLRPVLYFLHPQQVPPRQILALFLEE